MESCSSLTLKPPVLTNILFTSINSNWRRKKPYALQVSAISYKKFIHLALTETKQHTHLVSSPLQEKFSSIIEMDGKTELQLLAFQAPKVRLLRSLSIESEALQVLDFAVLPEPEVDIPIFCANFFTTASMNIIVLDLNPLHDVITHRDYKDKYYKSLMALGLKYAEISCSFCRGEESLQAWLELMDEAIEVTDASQILCNREAQHRYLTWRAEKDPGHGVLKRLVGETRAKDLVRNFLFYGIDELGSKQFLDYFPEYRCEDGTINEKRSIVGKSYENRPWDATGEFVGNNFAS